MTNTALPAVRPRPNVLRRRTALVALLVASTVVAACGSGSPSPSPTATAGATDPTQVDGTRTDPSRATATPTSPTESTTDSGGVLLFGIGMHIEPMGVTAQGITSRSSGDYGDVDYFERHVEHIATTAEIIERHGGAMTIQAQSPFTTYSAERDDTLLADLYANGHEIALHFHEDAHLGIQSESLPSQTWCDVMKEEAELVRAVSGGPPLRYWSGGNLYPKLFEAASCAGFDVNSDWKNPETQTTDIALVGVNPWRPAGGTDGSDLTVMAKHDPSGPIVFLPEGLYDDEGFGGTSRSEKAGGDEEFFNYLEGRLMASIAGADPSRVNGFHFTVHPAEFVGDRSDPFAVIDDFLAKVVDPLVASGQVRWATFSEMADAYLAWEQANPTADPRGEAAVQTSSPTPVAPTTSGKSTEVSEAFFAVHVETSDHNTEAGSVGDEWHMVAGMIEHADRYGHKLTLEFHAQWAEHALANPERLSEMRRWEADGHEIALHHHGLDHVFWDGYTNEPGHRGDVGYRGTMAEAMAMMSQLPVGGEVRTAGMTDEDTDWWPTLVYETGESGKSGGGLLSEPKAAAHDEIEVTQLAYTGFELTVGPQTKLPDVVAALEGAEAGQVLGLVSHPFDYWEKQDAFDALFAVLVEHGLSLQTVTAIHQSR